MSLEGVTMAGFMMTGGLLTGAGLLAATPYLQKKLIAPLRQDHLSDQLPFDRVLKGDVTLKNKDESLTQTVELEGIDEGPLREEDLTKLLKRRQEFFDRLNRSSLKIKLITLREKVEESFEAAYHNLTLKRIHEAWMRSFKDSYRNRHFLILTDTSKTGASAFGERVQEALQPLKDFRPKVLKNDGDASPLLSFWGTLVNGESVTLGSFSNHLSERLTARTLNFDFKSGLITWGDGARTYHGAILSLNQWGDESGSGILKDLQSLKCKSVILQLLKAHPKLKAKVMLEDQKRQKLQFFKSQKCEDEFNAALELVEGEEATLLDLQTSILMIEETEPGIQKRLNEAKAIFTSYGILPVQETLAVEHIFKSLFPGPQGMVRKTHPLSYNLAHLTSFGREPQGFSKCDWGEGPIRTFKTLSGAPYALQLHVTDQKEALAHSLVIAPSSSGKTTLFEHLIGGALRHKDLKAFIFDRFCGTQIFTKSLNGNIVDLNKGSVPLNPLILPETPSNQAFLSRFLKQLAQSSDPEIERDIRSTLELLKGTPRDARVLKDLYGDLFPSKSALQKGMLKWIEGPLDLWFNGAKNGHAYDALDLTANPLTTFEMTEVLADSETAAPITHYLFHRIREIVRNTANPYLLFIDEAAPMLADPYFKGRIAIELKEARKLRGSVHLCFQNVGDLLKSGISSVILEQCPTRFLFPNPSARREDYKIFDLSDQEWAYIKGESKAHKTHNRTVLLKRPQESVILDIDLEPLGNLLKLYKSGSEPLKKAEALQKQYGGDQWIDQYLAS